MGVPLFIAGFLAVIPAHAAVTVDDCLARMRTDVEPAFSHEAAELLCNNDPSSDASNCAGHLRTEVKQVRAATQWKEVDYAAAQACSTGFGGRAGYLPMQEGCLVDLLDTTSSAVAAAGNMCATNPTSDGVNCFKHLRQPRAKIAAVIGDGDAATLCGQNTTTSAQNCLLHLTDEGIKSKPFADFCAAVCRAGDGASNCNPAQNCVTNLVGTQIIRLDLVKLSHGKEKLRTGAIKGYSDTEQRTGQILSFKGAADLCGADHSTEAQDCARSLATYRSSRVDRLPEDLVVGLCRANPSTAASRCVIYGVEARYPAKQVFERCRATPLSFDSSTVPLAPVQSPEDGDPLVEGAARSSKKVVEGRLQVGAPAGQSGDPSSIPLE